jgi:predicted dehydrogenase
VKLTAAVIGCGRIGSAYDEATPTREPRTHAGAYANSPAVSLVAGVDPDAERRRAFTERWGVRAFESVPAMLRDVRPDLWSICTPPDVRDGVVAQAIAAGARALWCEKPLASDAATAARIADRVATARVAFAVGYQRRWDRGHQQAAEWLHDGRAGRIENVAIRYTRGLRNYGTHAIDLVRWYVGEIAWAWGHRAADGGDADPSPSAVLGADGATVALLAVGKESYDVFEVDVMGSEGRLLIDDLGRRIRWFGLSSAPEWGEPRVVSSSPSEELEGMRGYMAAALANVVDAVNGEARVLCGANDGVRALEIAEAIEGSVRHGATVACAVDRG